VGRFSSLLFNSLTSLLTRYLPLDLAKVAAVMGVFVAALYMVKLLERRFSNPFIRIVFTVGVFISLISGVVHSEDHITQDSFWFGSFARILDDYF
jgi:hypothetical protein